MASLIGKIINKRYRVEESLGRGGMAEVYLAFDLQRSIPLAIKVLRDDLAEDQVFLHRFQREAQSLLKLQHPNIVRCYGLEQEERLAFILMEYIDGTTLRGKIFENKGPLSEQEVFEIIRPICSALHYAHQQGIVHCDLKSSNIMLDKNGKAYLTDFGIARMIDAATSTLIGVGTPAYMAPELILGHDPTPQTDIYALGITLFEMYSGGVRPFTGDKAQTTGTISEKIRWEQLHLESPLITDLNSEIPTHVSFLIQKCLSKEPAQRPLNSMQILRELEQKGIVELSPNCAFVEEENSISPRNQSIFSRDVQIKNKEIFQSIEYINYTGRVANILIWVMGSMMYVIMIFSLFILFI